MNQRVAMSTTRSFERQAALTSLARASLIVARGVTGPIRHSEWPEDQIATLLTKGASSPVTIGDNQGLTEHAMHLLAALSATSAAAEVLGRCLQISLGNKAQVSVPVIAVPNAQWIGEGRPIGMQQGSTAPGPTLKPHKLASLLSLTREMSDSSDAEAVMRQMLIESLSPVLDAALFSANAETADQPAGLLEGIAPLVASTAASSLDGMVQDIGKLAQALAPASGSGQPILIAAPASAAALSFALPRAAWPIYSSAALASGTIIGLIAEGIAADLQMPRVDAAAEMEVHMESAAGEIVDIGGVNAVPVKSMFQTDTIGLRVLLPATWARRSASAVAWMQTNWWAP